MFLVLFQGLQISADLALALRVLVNNNNNSLRFSTTDVYAPYLVLASEGNPSAHRKTSSMRFSQTLRTKSFVIFTGIAEDIIT
jgi:uncharacterized protein YegL